jgi:CHASE2 domain-containing sensor protein
MGRKDALLGFWLIGYVLGIIAWQVRTPAVQFIETLGLSADTAGALLMGFICSIVMVVGVLINSFLSSS